MRKQSERPLFQLEIIRVAKSPVLTVAPTNPLLDTARVMTAKGFRRLPVVEPSSKKLLGIVAAKDLVHYFGGLQCRMVKKGFPGTSRRKYLRA